MPISKCTQFSVREVGEPGNGTVTSGTVAKSGGILNAEQQGWFLVDLKWG